MSKYTRGIFHTSPIFLLSSNGLPFPPPSRTQPLFCNLVFQSLFQLNGKTHMYKVTNTVLVPKGTVTNESHGVSRALPNKNKLVGRNFPSDSLNPSASQPAPAPPPQPPWIAQPCPCPSDLRMCFPFYKSPDPHLASGDKGQKKREAIFPKIWGGGGGRTHSWPGIPPREEETVGLMAWDSSVLPSPC